MVGIYKITSPTGRIYIGQSWDIKERLRGYRKPSFINKKQPILSNSFTKYGVGNHLFEIVHELPYDIDQKTLDVYEIFYWQQHIDCGFKMLNSKEPGLGGKLSQETKDKLSKSHTGKKISEETKKKISAFFKGRKNPLTANHGEDNGFYGKKHSDESKKKMSEYGKTKTKEKNPFYGKEHTEATKKKISEKNKGRIVSDYSKQRTSETHKGKPKSEEAIKKLSLSLMGHKSWNKGMKFTKSEETKNRISAAKKGKPNGHLGLKYSEESKKKMSEAQKDGRHAGEKNPNFGNKARLAAAERKRPKVAYSFGYIN